MTRSGLFVGRVRHTRLRPVTHSFSYRVFYTLIDVDELEDLDESLRLFSVDRFNLFSFRPSDHGGEAGDSLRSWAERQLADAGVSLDGGRIELLAFPRVLGHVFNPISVWYCYDRSGELAAVMHEVRNTFGDKRTYVVPISGGLSHDVPKQLHVSPFMDMDQTYSFTLTKPGATISVGIRQRDDEGELFTASISGRRRHLTDRALLQVFFTHPLVTLKTVGGIHWQALRLWAKGMKYRPRPAAPARAVSIVTKEDGE